MIYLSYGIADFLIVALAVLTSIILHELAHGYVALWNGDYTAKVNGRLTLNPLVHFDVIGFVMLMTVGFGYAKPVPVNPYNFKKRRTGLFLVAIAGVSLNLIMAFFSVGLYYFMNWLSMRFPSAATVLSFFQLFFLYMVMINISLALFNVLPIYPLDGFRVLESCTRFINPVTKFLRDYGQFILLFLVGISIIVSFLESRVPIMRYFDLLGQYIYYGRRGITWVFEKFWGLIF